MGKKAKRKDAEKAADLLLEAGGLAKLDRDRLKDLAVEAARYEVAERSPGYWTLSFINHGDGCLSMGDSFEDMKSFQKRIRESA